MLYPIHDQSTIDPCYFEGREYTFDVRYTWREVQDRARRHLYHTANEVSACVSAPSMPRAGRGSPPSLPGLTTSSVPGLDSTNTPQTSRSRQASPSSLDVSFCRLALAVSESSPHPPPASSLQSYERKRFFIGSLRISTIPVVNIIILV